VGTEALLRVGGIGYEHYAGIAYRVNL